MGALAAIRRWVRGRLMRTVGVCYWEPSKPFGTLLMKNFGGMWRAEPLEPCSGKVGTLPIGTVATSALAAFATFPLETWNL